ncbi:MAG TPA: glycosyltransferase [Planctomycetota bacterium]|nr:glycosyltransferase [Planctomycetota bacterium]
MEITAVIPMFNEAQRVDATVRSVLDHLDGLGGDGEVLCVDDGSADDTAARVEALSSADPRVRLVRLPHNRGKGAAVRAGVLEARGRFIFVLDADLSAPPDAIDDALPHLRDGAHWVAGSRSCPGADVVQRQGIVRRVLGRCFLNVARRLVDPKATDLTCGFKGFRSDVARAIFLRSRIDGWAFDAETALIGRRLRLVRRDIPVRWTNDPDSRVRVGRAVLQSTRDLARIMWNDARGRYREVP